MENLKEGFRFRPSDAEGLTFLLRFITGQVMNDSGFITTNVDTYGKQEPWETYTHGLPCGDDDGDCTQYRFFITKLKKKYGSRYSRNVGNKGTWKQQDKIKPVVQKNGGPVIGFKKNMSYVNKGYDGKYGHWLMKEYDLSRAILEKFDDNCRDYVLCAIKKSISKAAMVLNNVPEETRSNYVCRNLERETPAFLKFQESTHESAAESTITTNLCRKLERESPAVLKFQESALESTSTSNYDAGGYIMQSKSVPALELNQLIKKDLEVLGDDAGDCMQSNSPELHEDVNVVVEPLLAPCTFEATSMLSFDHEYYLPDLDPWDILLDSDDIDQILPGT